MFYRDVKQPSARVPARSLWGKRERQGAIGKVIWTESEIGIGSTLCIISILHSVLR